MQRTEWLYSHVDFLEGTERSAKLRECRSYAWFARHVETGVVKVMSNSCRLRWCPICSSARSSFLIGQVHAWLKSVRRPKFLTVTMKHTNAPLEHQIKWLYRHFRKFRQRPKIAKHIYGGIWFFQLKKTDSDEPWHPHLHCVIDSRYIPQTELSSEWKAQTGSSSIVDIRAVKSVRAVAEYVSRYCARPARLTEFNDKEALEIFSVFHGRRLCGTWGSGRNASLRPPRCSRVAEWESVGTWRSVIKQCTTLPRARTIVNAFFSGEAIPRGLFVDRFPPGATECLKADFPVLGLEDIKGHFEEFL